VRGEEEKGGEGGSSSFALGRKKEESAPICANQRHYYNSFVRQL